MHLCVYLNWVNPSRTLHFPLSGSARVVTPGKDIGFTVIGEFWHIKTLVKLEMQPLVNIFVISTRGIRISLVWRPKVMDGPAKALNHG